MQWVGSGEFDVLLDDDNDNCDDDDDGGLFDNHQNIAGAEDQR